MTPPEVVVRPGRIDDIGPVLALWLRAGAVPSATDDEASVRRLVTRADAPLLLASVHGYEHDARMARFVRML